MVCKFCFPIKSLKDQLCTLTEYLGSKNKYGYYFNFKTIKFQSTVYITLKI